ncbi:AlbA family DNA-binding domain-containing protein [Pseudomonas cerasi]
MSKEGVPLYKRDLADISELDLNEIGGLEEGWFVEFKSTPPDNIKIAKSMSSFANAYGGVLIFGVIEEQKTRKVKSIEGFEKNEADKIILRVRESVDSHVTPCPYYDIKSIPNGVDNQGVDRFIVWVKVPKGDNGPYLHSSGCIYTRKGDSSFPIPLTDLGLLERMWRDTESQRMKIKDRIEYLHSLLPESYPRIEIFVVEEENHNDDYYLDFHEFKDLALSPFEDNKDSNYNNVYSLDSSFVAQHVSPANIGSGVNIMWDYDRDRCLHHIIIPLATGLWEGKNFENTRGSDNGLQELKRYLIANKFERKAFIINMSYCLAIISKSLTKIHQMTKKYKGGRSLYANFKISGVKNSIAVLDFERFYNELNDSVIPFISRDPGFKYPLQDQLRWMKLNFEVLNKNPSEELMSLDIVNTMVIFMHLCHSIGISHYVTMGMKGEETNPEDISNLFSKLLTGGHSFNCSSNPSYQ